MKAFRFPPVVFTRACSGSIIPASTMTIMQTDPRVLVKKKKIAGLNWSTVLFFFFLFPSL
jgi:hypothetical protein